MHPSPVSPPQPTLSLHLRQPPILPYTHLMASFETTNEPDIYIAGDDFDTTRKYLTSLDREKALNLTIDEYLNLEDTIPWEPLPHETMKSWKAFMCYRDAGAKRSISYVRGTGITVAALWQQKYKWTLRTRLYDEYVQSKEIIETHKLNKEIRQRHADQAAQALDGLMAPFLEYQRRSDEDPEQLAADMKTMDAKKLISTMQASARVLQPLMSAERLSQDLPTEMIETHVQGQITVQDSPEALIDVLTVLEETGILNALFGTRQVIEIVDAEDESVDTDSTPPEAASLPAGTS